MPSEKLQLPYPQPDDTAPLLEVRDLSISFDTHAGVLPAVEDVSFSLYPGDILGLVGESGSGKTVTVSSLVGLLPDNALVNGGEILYKGKELLGLADGELKNIRGKEIAMVFQDLMTSLNPVMRVGSQIAEALRIHGVSRAAARQKALDLLDLVGIPNPRQRYRQFPHEMSGGMRQRVVIADEPTTALTSLSALSAKARRAILGLRFMRSG